MERSHALDQILRALARGIEAFNGWIGNGLAFFVWGSAAVCAVVVFLRYVMHMSFIWMQELYVWLHAIVFMIGAGYAMAKDAHVRVDIFYARWSPRKKASMEIVGVILFVLPWTIALAWLAWPFVRMSWMIREGSAQPSGLAFQYVFKSVVLAFCAIVTLQAIAVLARCILTLRGDPESTARYALSDNSVSESSV